MAAEVIKEAFDKNDFSEAQFKKYKDAWEERRGKQMREILKVRKFFEKLSDEDIDNIASLLDPEAVFDFTEGQKIAAYAKLFVKHPRIAMIAAKTLLVGR